MAGLPEENINKSFSRFAELVKDTFTPTGNFDIDKKRGEDYAKLVGMDDANTKMTIIMTTQGPVAAAKAMLDEFNGDYFKMRTKYG